MSENGLLKLFQGVKDGALKSTNGEIIEEEAFVLKNIKIFKFKISLPLDGKTSLLESYVFVYKNTIYSLQFMNNQSEFSKHNELRKRIIDSIAFH